MKIVSQHTVLQARDLKIGYKGRRGTPQVVAEGINADLHAGEVVCLMGPNGSGKSTLIKTLAGMQAPLSGDISLFDEPVAALTPKDIARKLSTVLTDRITIGNLDVFTLVSFGRSPYTGWLGRLREEDEKIVRWAIGATGLEPLVHRDISTLSDGERQKVMIARALAQDTDLILLDEPTAHLDLPNRVEIMRLLRKLAGDTGKAILLSTHELDLALKAGDSCWLMNDEQELFSGTSEDLVLNGIFEAVFARDSFDFDRATGTFNLHESNGKTIAVTGHTVGVFWTRRALEREGFEIAELDKTILAVDVREGGNGFEWVINTEEGAQEECNSIEAMIHAIETVDDSL